MMMGYGFLLMFVFFAIIIGLAVWLITYLFPSISEPLTTNRQTAPQTPLEILNSRYARGEISKSEYEEIRRTLKYE